MNIISSRDTKKVRAYINNVYHEDVPIPSNWLIPENSDPTKYGDNSDSAICPFCRKPVLLNTPGQTNIMLNTDGMYDCPQCGGRFSNIHRDKGYSHYGMTPGTLDPMGGSNTNNESQGINYHPGATSNQDTFSSNLGK